MHAAHDARGVSWRHLPRHDRGDRRTACSLRTLQGPIRANPMTAWTPPRTTKTCSRIENRYFGGRLGAGLLPGTGICLSSSPRNRARSRALPGSSAAVARPRSWPWGKTARNRQNLPVDALGPVWQDRVAMNESEKQFSFTRTAPSTSGRTQNQIPISN